MWATMYRPYSKLSHQSRQCHSNKNDSWLPCLCCLQDRYFNVFCFVFNSHCGGWSPNWVHSARRPFTGLVYLPRVIVRMENSVEWRLTGETEVLGENLPRATLSTTNPTWPDLGSNPGRRGGKPATNRLSYGAALFLGNWIARLCLFSLHDDMWIKLCVLSHSFTSAVNCHTINSFHCIKITHTYI
jgi:hypothetical protein